ncbi:MAG: SH3 domain-containing protein [Thermomicrobiales bacterium]
MRAGWLAIPLALVIGCASMFVQIQPASADTDLDIGGEARVSYTGGDSIRVRSTPSYDGSVVTSVPEGWLVAILDGPISDGEGSQWYKVTARGQTGYMVSDYLARPGSSGSSTSGSQTSAAATMYTTTSLRLRASASTSGAILLVMPAGASVSTTGTTQNGYSQLTYQGTTGWAASQYLSSNPPSSGSGTVISNAWVIGGSPEPAFRAPRCRAASCWSCQVERRWESPVRRRTDTRRSDTTAPISWAYSQYLSSSQPGGNSGTVISNATRSLADR